MTKTDDVTAVQTPTEAEAALRAAATPRDNRFTPGTVLLNRYRVISLLGRGGMGEVYRADDMKLGQQVALKFVPRELAKDATTLAHLYSEVRIGRDVAHPNVCRLYDIVEYDGDHFIAMQYVDGEDLASLLRRIGRLPVEKAIDIARDLCAGLAAAHDRGVIHRDLKPANVMVDGNGRAHITDFGLAILSDDPQKRGIAGTPAYMAPEQRRGERVTPSSDLYAFGLIFFEMLTGKRLASGVRDLPPQVEAVVRQCLEEDAANRPRSARSVLAALPGGDPLAAAVAAGETPSPEMVAAASKSGALPAPVAVGAIALTIAMLVGVAALTPRTTLFSSARLRKTPDALSDRAEEIVHAAGFAGDPADHDGFFVDRNQIYRAKVADRDRLAFVYRRSPVPLTTLNAVAVVRTDDPPLTYPRSANVQLSGDGRLLSLVAIPDDGDHVAPNAIDELFRAAGYERGQFHPVPPRAAPPVGCDQRMAWDGPAHIEAASFHGAVDWFAVNPLPIPPPAVDIAGIGGYMFTFIYLALQVLGVVFSIRNLRRGRTDTRGALRTAIVAFCLTLPALVLQGHITRVNLGVRIPGLLAQAAIDSLVFIAMYLAAEPYVRRYWPTPLISWQRLIEGQWRDSLVARDFGIGIAIGILSMLKTRLFVLFSGGSVPVMRPFPLAPLASPARAAGWILHVPGEAVTYGLAGVFFILLARVFIRRAVIYIPLFVVLLAVATWPDSGNAWLDAVNGLIGASLLVIAIHEGGMLMVCAAWAASHLLEGLPLTLDIGAWFATPATFAALLLIVITAAAFFRTTTT
jgi:serine/threonine-protein kinase